MMQYIAIRKEESHMATHLTLVLTSELREAIRIAAAKAGLSTAAWVRKILEHASGSKD